MKINYPNVTFIIPTLNAGKFLGECLKAIREQNYPRQKIEILVVDGGSKDNTINIAKSYKAKVLRNPEILHEPGKSIGSKKAKGEILFYTDSDNILSHSNWIKLMVLPYIQNKKVKGFLPQTIPGVNSNPLDRYLGYLFTDPFTWFVYGNSANPHDYHLVYKPVKKTKNYILYRFPEKNFPLFGFSQGVGVVRSFDRGQEAHADDILAGMKLIKERGLIAYIPHAGIYHYHITGFKHFISKYRWRIRNNLSNQVKGMGINNRVSFFDQQKKRRIKLFIPYSFSIILPVLDSIKLSIKYKDSVMLLHTIACVLLAALIVQEIIIFKLSMNNKIGVYQ